MNKKSIISLGLVVLSLGFTACNTKNEPEQPVSPTDSTETPVDSIVKPVVKSGEFSISATQKVLFSPGNLQYQASTKTYRFASKQYEALGKLNENISSTNDGWIDLFGWGTGNNPALSTSENTRYWTFTDWGTKVIGEDTANTWRTLKQAEWNYILFVRPNADKLFAGATVNNVQGLLLLPDNWTTPASVSFTPSTDKGLVIEGDSAANWRYVNETRNNFKHNVYTAEEWTVLENAGAIFLPVDNYRWGKTYYGEHIAGYYWCADLDEENCWTNSYVAYWVDFNAMEVACKNYCDVAMGNSVRLAKDM